MDDEELMMKYQMGSEEAFNRLYEKYSPLVYGFIRKRLRAQEVDDFYQKVWRHLHEKRDLYQAQPFAPWFFVMIRNLLTDEYRALGRHKLAMDEVVPNEVFIDVSELLSTLPAESATLVRKYYIEGMNYEELSRETGLSSMNLRQRLSRALKKLRGMP